MSFKDISYLMAPFKAGRNHLCNFGRMHHRNISVILFRFLTSGSGGNAI